MSHQPRFPTSCRRRVPADIEGTIMKIVARFWMYVCPEKRMRSRTDVGIVSRTVNRYQSQKSWRLVRHGSLSNSGVLGGPRYSCLLLFSTLVWVRSLSQSTKEAKPAMSKMSSQIFLGWFLCAVSSRTPESRRAKAANPWLI